jgi:hypothetical protein
MCGPYARSSLQGNADATGNGYAVTRYLPLQFLPHPQDAAHVTGSGRAHHRRIAVDGKPLRYHGCGSCEEARDLREAGSMNLAVVMRYVFLAAVLCTIVVALRTGRAYYGGMLLELYYIERAKQPLVFWVFVACLFALAIMVSDFIWMPIISN